MTQQIGFARNPDMSFFLAAILEDNSNHSPGEVFDKLVAPFHYRDAIGREFFKTDVSQFIVGIDPVNIEMPQFADWPLVEPVYLLEDKGRACDMSAMAKGSQQFACEVRFTGSQVTFERQDFPTFERPRERGCKTRCVFARFDVKLDARYHVISSVNRSFNTLARTAQAE